MLIKVFLLHSAWCLVAQAYLTLCNLCTVACQAFLSMGFFRQKYWSGLPFPAPGDLPDPGIEPTSPVSPALQENSLPTEPRGIPKGPSIIC